MLATRRARAPAAGACSSSRSTASALGTRRRRARRRARSRRSARRASSTSFAPGSRARRRARRLADAARGARDQDHRTASRRVVDSGTRPPARLVAPRRRRARRRSRHDLDRPLRQRRAPARAAPSTEPPKPPPISRAPAAPARRSRSTVASTAGVETWYRSRRLACEASSRAPSAAMSCAASAADRLPHPRVLLDHVAGAPRERRGKHARDPPSWASRSDATPEPLAGLGAFAAALVVSRARHGRGARPESATANRQPPSASCTGETSGPRKSISTASLGGAEQARELVEQSRAGTGPLVLDPRAQARQLDARGARARGLMPRHGQLAQRQAQRDGQCRRGRQAGAAGHVPLI